jgi:hypothetical protein
MASIRKEILVKSSAHDVWVVIGDFGTGPSRMAPDYVVDTRVEGDSRVVTFANGTVSRERFVSVDDDARRIVYAIIGDTLQPAHNNALPVAGGRRDHQAIEHHQLLGSSPALVVPRLVDMIQRPCRGRPGW